MSLLLIVVFLPLKCWKDCFCICQCLHFFFVLFVRLWAASAREKPAVLPHASCSWGNELPSSAQHRQWNPHAFQHLLLLWKRGLHCTAFSIFVLFTIYRNGWIFNLHKAFKYILTWKNYCEFNKGIYFDAFMVKLMNEWIAFLKMVVRFIWC